MMRLTADGKRIPGAGRLGIDDNAQQTYLEVSANTEKVAVNGRLSVVPNSDEAIVNFAATRYFQTVCLKSPSVGPDQPSYSQDDVQRIVFPF